MSNPGSPSKPSSYDRYVDVPRLLVAVGVFVGVLMIPIPESMRDVAVEYTAGTSVVTDHFSRELFGTPVDEAEQWQLFAVRALESCIRQGVVTSAGVLKRDAKSFASAGIRGPSAHYEAFREMVEGYDPEALAALLADGRALRHDRLAYDDLSSGQQAAVDRSARHILVALAMIGFVVVCFVTEAIPLPGVAFCIGLILVFSGIVGREQVASLYWSDACWFIMGSLMFAAAFVKTGVDKRICLIVFRVLARPSVPLITGMMILVIAPLASFISDHALAAIFLPIGMILYANSLTPENPRDPELAKMLMITIAMACNIGGFGSPSGGARNVIVMTYLEDMFGITMGYAQWMMFGMPFVVVMVPITWAIINLRFKPRIRDLGPALETLRADIGRMGGWNRQQVIAVTVFLVMLFGWITEKGLIYNLLGIRLGIGVIAVAGAVAYLLLGVVNWRDYQEKVDWGVVWLYAGAIIFGRTLDETGAAYWLARSFVNGLASIGLDSGIALVGAGGLVTAVMTNLMADGPAAAAVAPITLNMAGVAAPGSMLIPFMCLATACASSFANLLIIGTPPNAIVYSSGHLEAKDFLRAGIPGLIAAFAVLLLMTQLLWPMIGFAGLDPIP